MSATTTTSLLRDNNHAQLATSADLTDDLYTVREVAQKLRVDDTTVRRWIKSNVLPAIILPHQGKRLSYRVTSSTVAALLAPQKSEVSHAVNRY